MIPEADTCSGPGVGVGALAPARPRATSLVVLVASVVAAALPLTGTEALAAPEREASAASPAAERRGPSRRPSTPGALEAPVEPDALARHRVPLELLLERTLAETSRAVRFDWRRARLGASLSTAQLLELNSYSSASLALGVRFPVGPVLVDVSAARVWTWATESSARLALTPYRQAGRPTRLELQANLSVPLAEGVTTVRWAFVPALEVVFSVDVGLRYLLYPEGLRGLSTQEAATALFSPTLSTKERESLERARLPAMSVDPGRYGVLTGLSLHLFAQSGLFFAPRLLLGLPFSRAFEATALGLWWEVALAAGWMVP